VKDAFSDATQKPERLVWGGLAADLDFERAVEAPVVLREHTLKLLLHELQRFPDVQLVEVDGEEAPPPVAAFAAAVLPWTRRTISV